MYTSATYEPAVTSPGDFTTQECSIGFPRLPGVSLWYFSKQGLNYFFPKQQERHSNVLNSLLQDALFSAHNIHFYFSPFYLLGFVFPLNFRFLKRAAPSIPTKTHVTVYNSQQIHNLLHRCIWATVSGEPVQSPEVIKHRACRMWRLRARFTPQQF